MLEIPFLIINYFYFKQMRIFLFFQIQWKLIFLLNLIPVTKSYCSFAAILFQTSTTRPNILFYCDFLFNSTEHMQTWYENTGKFKMIIKL